MVERLTQIAKEAGATHTAVVDTSKLQFLEDIRDICEKNTCRMYDANWKCPPNCGTLEECETMVKGYPQGLLLQTVCQLEDSFDFEGMEEGTKTHEKMFFEAMEKMKAEFPNAEFTFLNAGPCPVCEKCAIPSPCIHPEKAISSIEAQGIYVNQMLVDAGLKYNNGESTVFYVGMVLFR